MTYFTHVQSFYKVPLYKKLLSYLVPVTLRKGKEDDGSPVQVVLSNNTFQLASATALYSDGMKYRPFRLAFKQLDAAFIAGINDCLILGTGLGSIVQILHRKYGAAPSFYLVEKEEVILQWAMELLGQLGIKKIYPYCCDAGAYLKQSGVQYDLVCVDIFKDRTVPGFYISEIFLEACRRALRPGGIWIMNYIINDEEEWMGFSNRASKVFTSVTVLENEQNRILICKYGS